MYSSNSDRLRRERHTGQGLEEAMSKLLLQESQVRTSGRKCCLPGRVLQTWCRSSYWGLDVLILSLWCIPKSLNSRRNVLKMDCDV